VRRDQKVIEAYLGSAAAEVAGKELEEAAAAAESST
jgi:hypothetical protein